MPIHKRFNGIYIVFSDLPSLFTVISDHQSVVASAVAEPKVIFASCVRRPRAGLTIIWSVLSSLSSLRTFMSHVRRVSFL